MKTLVKWVVAVAVITVFLCCASALADNLTWTISGDVMTISGTGDMDDYTGKPLWYDDCNSRTGHVHSVIISDGVTSIGSNAFYGCSLLNSITIPNSVTRVGAGAFTSCGAIRYAGADTAAAEALSRAGYSFRVSGNNYNIRYLYTGEERTGLSIDTVDNTVTSFVFPEGVKEIGNYAFSNCRNLTEITIPETVESIGTGAFQGCAGLTEIAIPEGVERIEVNTFSGCNNLAGITIPGSLKSIGTGAFTECWSMTNIHIASIQAWAGILFESKESFPTNYFTPAHNNPTRLYIGNEEVTEVEIPGGITSIGNYAFYKCRNITSVALPQGITSIGNYAFCGCSGMTGITIQEGLESIGESAFSGCIGLMGVSLPDGVTTIGQKAFYNCSSMTELSLPDHVTSIGKDAFYNCRNLTEITIPERLTTIADNTFQNCSGLTELTIPAGITRIGSYALNGCSSLGKVTFSGYSCTFGQSVFSDPAPAIYCIRGSNADSWATGNEYQVSYLDKPQQEYSGTDGNIQWTLTQNGVLTISGNGAMRNYSAQDYAPWGTAVTKAVIEKGVISIGAYAFSGCSGLTEITIPNSVTGIQSYAFSGCSNLTEITIPMSVTNIGNYAFSGCSSLTDVTILGNTCTFGENLFSTSPPTIHCNNNSDAHTWATENHYSVEILPVISGTDGQLSWELHEGGALYISGTGDMNNYTEFHTPWYGYAITHVEIGNGVTGIGDYAFAYCGLLESITIPNGVKRIGQSAFSGCTGLTSVTFPAGLETVGFSAFAGCSAISEIHVPSLEAWFSITYGEGQSRPHQEAQAWRLYVNGEEPTELIIPASITAIPDYAFRKCTSLESVTIQAGVTSIGNVAFANCPNLESVIIPDSVTTIGSSAFSGCTDGMSVTIGKNVSEMGYELIGNADTSSNVRIQADLDTETARMLGKRGYAFRLPNQKYTLKYTFTGDTVSGLIVTGADQDITKAALPNTVTGIAANAFVNCESLTEITIPGSIKSIGNSAFSGSTNISTIHLSDIKSWLTIQYGNASSHPNSGSCHLYIGEQEITAVTIPDSITTIEELAFSGCSGLTEIMVPANVTRIGNSAMQGCISLTQVTIEGNRCSFGSNIFTGTAPTICCYKGSDADIWATEQQYPITYLENALPVDSGDDGNIHWEIFADGELRISGTGAMKDYSFSNAPWSRDITKAVIEEGITTIGNYALYGRDKLESVTIPDSVISIGDSAFEQCGSLKSVNIPQGVTSIGNFAFEYCTGLAGITIPNSVAGLGTGAFNHTGLKSVTIPNSITSIPNSAFSGSALQSVVISEGITEIGDYAFLGCTDLTSITLPSGMRHIGISAFAGCGNSAEIHISSIGDWLNIRFESGSPFSEQYSLFIGNTEQTAVTIPQGVTSIRDYAFQNCSLREITIPAGVTRIGSYALNGCTSLEKITILGNSCSFGNYIVSAPLPTVYCYDGSDADGWAGRNGCTVFHLENPVPVASGTDGNIQWERYANGELRISGTGRMPNYSTGTSAAPWGTSITDVIIENGVTSIGNYAFYNCSRLTSIALPDSVKSIEYCAFSQCYGLRSIAIPGVNYIGNSAFNSCTSLHEIHISSIEAWLRIAMQTAQTLPQSYSLYIDNVEQTSITIPESVNSIQQYAFMNCTGIREIFIPEGVRLIGQYAFYGCSNLTEITLPYSAVSSGMHAFENCASLEKVTVLSRNFEFDDSSFNRTPKPTIYCYADSKAATWASRKSYPRNIWKTTPILHGRLTTAH